METQTQNPLLGTEEEPESLPTNEEKTAGMLAHLLTVISSFLAPLIIFLIKKDESAFVASHAKESLNFQITIFLISFLLFISIIGILLLWLVGIIALVLVIVASLKASEGKLYRYPFCIRILK